MNPIKESKIWESKVTWIEMISKLQPILLIDLIAEINFYLTSLEINLFSEKYPISIF